MNLVKLIKQTDGAWVEQPATLVDIVNPTVMLGNSASSVARAAAYGLIAALLMR